MSWPFQPLLAAAADLLATVPSGVQVDAVTTGSSDGNPSVSHTCTGTDRALYLIINHRFDWTPTATYNSVALTQIGRQTNSNTVTVTAFRLIAPDTGSNTLAISGNGGSDDLLYTIISLTGVDQTTPEGTIVSGTGTGTSPSLSVTSEADGLVIDALAVLMTAAQTITVGAGQTERHNATNAPDLRGGVSTEPGATSVTSSWTISASATYTNLAIPVSPAAAAVDVSITAVPCVALADALLPTPSISVSAGGVALADFVAPTPSISITAVGVAAAAGLSPTPSITVTAVVVATAVALPPTASAGTNVSITAVPAVATAVGLSPTPGVSVSSVAVAAAVAPAPTPRISVTAVGVATATGLAPTPGITVTAVAVALADAPPPVVGSDSPTIIAPPAAVAYATFPINAVDVSIHPLPASAAASAPAPTVGITARTIVAPPAIAYATFVVNAVDVTIVPLAATATASLAAPNISSATVNVEVVAPAITVSALAVAPIPGIEVSAVATATAEGIVPAVVAERNVTVASAVAIAYATALRPRINGLRPVVCDDIDMTPVSCDDLSPASGVFDSLDLTGVSCDSLSLGSASSDTLTLTEVS